MKNLYAVIITLLLLFNFNLVSFADNGLSDKAKYKQAEEQLAFDNFDKALELYFELYKGNNQNFNYVYKIGYCYLASENQQNIKTAIDYLLLASENTSKNYKNKYKENKAPVNSFYYLGVAYRLNKDFEKAIDAFNVYKQKMSRRDSKTIPGMFIDREIRSCYDAMEVIDDERMKIEKIVVKGLQEPNVRCPILCWEANRLIFTNGKYNVFPPDINYNTEYSEGPFDGVYIAERSEDGTFFNPQKISADLQIPYPFIPVTATSDGSELYLVADRYDNGDIYVSKFENGKYQPAQRVKRLNSRKWESHASITADGQRIYFTSLRRGGEGGLDIWYSDRDEDGKWQKPINAGPEINTPFHEEMPYVIRKGNALYFSSEAHTNVGGFDVFYASMDEQSQKWTSPVNLGYPFSTAGNDMGYVIENTPVFAFCPINDNKRRMGVEECDCISLVDEQAPQFALISGLIELEPENQEKLMQFRVKLVDENSGKEVANVKVDEKGYYLIEGINAGNYQITAYGKDANLMSKSIKVPQNKKWDIIGVNLLVDNIELADADIDTDVDPDIVADMDADIDADTDVVADSGVDIDIDADTDVVADSDADVDADVVTDDVDADYELIIEAVLFDFDKFDIKPEYKANLNLIAEYLLNNSEAQFKLVGHTDHYGSDDYNMMLSQKRVAQVQKYLLNKGAKESQLEIKFLGERENITIATANDNIRRLNRRVVVSVLKQGKESVKIVPITVPEQYKVK